MGEQTSDETVAAARAYAEAVGKTPITVTDSPGFVVNRILFPMINEAANAYHERWPRAEDIDTGMKLGANWPMGPLALADLVGLDTTKAILETLERELGDAEVQAQPGADASWSTPASSGARAVPGSTTTGSDQVVSPLERGYVQLYTGDGKGKTTASLGLVLRALGQGLRPAVLQFMKADPNWGEIVTPQEAGRAGAAVRARPLGARRQGQRRGPRGRGRRLRPRRGRSWRAATTTSWCWTSS